jgi:integrase
MARTVRDAKLETRTARGSLKPSGKPYYRALDEGLHLGYRKGKSGAGKWVFRRYVGAQSYAVETIATADDSADADGTVFLSYAQAQGEARRRFVEATRIAAGMPAQAGHFTVKDAIHDYLSWLERNRKSARDARWRAEALILPELGSLQSSKLTTHQLRDWRDALTKVGPRLRTVKGQKQRHAVPDSDDPEEVARRRRATANRTLTILKAALNHAWRERKIPSDAAWRPVTALKEADAARARYLATAECSRLINAADVDFRRLVQAALLTGCRFSELAALTVPDFHLDSGTLQIRTSKTGKARHVVLTEEGIAFFGGLTAGRSPRDRLLPKADGGKWLKSHQTRPMKEACLRASIEPPANFHVLRHTWASLAIMNAVPLMVVAKNLGHTDTRMVERHYGHLAQTYITDAIRAGAPRFGILAEPGVTPIVAASR